MSSREPLWYCYECHSEMRPLMVPDPHCASCNGTFVEKMENPADDPRDYQASFGGGDDEDDDGLAGDQFFRGLQNILRGTPTGQPPTGNAPPQMPGAPGRTDRVNPVGGTFTIRVDRTGDGPARTTISGGPTRTAGSTNNIPLFSEFIAGTGGPQGDNNTITGPLMAQYLFAMLAQRGGANGPFAGLFEQLPAGGAENGRWGDYVFNQEALDQIITQIMESSSSHPVPATEEITQKLPREVLEEGSPLLEKDCAVCKEQFKLETEDPDEQVVVTLPCNHPFHEPCILPWLKSSGTCPVCRYELIAQPHHHDPQAPGSSSSGPGEGTRGPSPGSGGGSNNQTNGNPPPGGLFSNLFHFIGNAGQQGSHDNTTGPNASGQAGSQSTTQRRHSADGRGDLPGGWAEDVD